MTLQTVNDQFELLLYPGLDTPLHEPLEVLQPPLSAPHCRSPPCGCSKASMRASSSSVSRIFLSNSIALRRVFISWFATAARPVSSSPASTSCVRSCSCALSPASSRLGLLLPAFEAALRRLSAFTGLCHQQNR